MPNNGAATVRVWRGAPICAIHSRAFCVQVIPDLNHGGLNRTAIRVLNGFHNHVRCWDGSLVGRFAREVKHDHANRHQHGIGKEDYGSGISVVLRGFVVLHAPTLTFSALCVNSYLLTVANICCNSLVWNGIEMQRNLVDQLV